MPRTGANERNRSLSDVFRAGGGFSAIARQPRPAQRRTTTLLAGQAVAGGVGDQGGDAVEQSDWDFLILVDGNVDVQRTDKIRHYLYELGWEFEEVISSIIRNKQEWNSTPFKSMPIHKEIDLEGIRL